MTKQALTCLQPLGAASSPYQPQCWHAEAPSGSERRAHQLAHGVLDLDVNGSELLVCGEHRVVHEDLAWSQHQCGRRDATSIEAVPLYVNAATAGRGHHINRKHGLQTTESLRCNTVHRTSNIRPDLSRKTPRMCRLMAKTRVPPWPAL